MSRPKLSALTVSALVLLSAIWLLRPASKQAPDTGRAAAPRDVPSAPAVIADEPVPSRTAPVAIPNQSAKPTAPLAATTALLEWSEHYLAASDSDRPALLAEGLALARERRPFLAELIRKDPEAALAAAVPRAIRSRLPAEIVAELEQRVSARAELAVIQSCLHPPGAAHDQSDDIYRSTVIDGREYRAHVYGSRLRDASLRSTSIIGIAMDRDLAVADTRLRVVDDAENTDSNAGTSVTVEADGVITVLPSRESLAPFAATLLASEQNPVIVEADSGAGSSGVSGRPTQAWTQGTKTLLVIPVDFSDLVGTPINKFDGNAQITPAYINNVINGANGVRAFLRQSSYGKTDILFDSAGDVTGVLRMPNTASSYATADDSSLLHTHARAAAVTAGFNPDAYDRVAVVFTYLGDLSGSQITYGGLANVVGPDLWVNGAFDLRVVGHELGHTYGLRHANLWKVADGNPVSLAGTSLEYGDPFDLMGDGDFFENDFSHWNKSLLQWIPDAAVTLAATSGTYRIHRFDSSAADLAAPRALKIVRDTTRDYWIGYRRGTSSSSADNGAYVLWGYNSAGRGNLLDLVTPGVDATNAPLPLNSTFNDTAAGITLRPVAQGGSGADEWLDVQVTLQPRIQWAATSYVANEQSGSVVLTVTRSANSTGAVSVAYATASGTAVGGTDFTAKSGTLGWADGDSSPKTITITLAADALVEGAETFTVTLSAPSGGVLVEPSLATVTVADPGARDPSFPMPLTGSSIFNAVVQPDGNILVGGAFSFIQTPDFTVYEHARIARLTPSAGVDETFDPGSGANGAVNALARQPDGKVLLAGDFSTINGIARNRVARLHPDGSLDTSFAPAGPDGAVNDMLLQPDGRILLVGAFANVNGVARNRIVRLQPDGALDATFANPTYSAGTALRSLALQRDGKILAAGGLNYGFGDGGGVGFKSGIVRLNADGTRDTSFDVGYGAHTSSSTSTLTTIQRVVVLPDDRIVVSGSFSGFNNSARGRIARLNSNGSLDATFAPSADNTVYALLPLPDGSLLAGGDFTTVGGVSASRIVRILSNGAVDTAFAAAGGHSSTVRHLALQSDGNVLLAGNLGTFQGTTDSRPLWRLIPGLAGLPGVVQFAADAASGVEGANATLTVTRGGGSLGALTIGYATVAGTASAGSDFTATSGSLSWADGDASAKTITVPLASDALADTPESLVVNLGAPQIGGALLADRQQATVTIATAFTAWQATHFSSAEIADSAVSGDSADPDGDGLANLTEFALGRNPRLADASGAWSTAVQKIGGVDYLTLTFKRRAPALDLTYAVQSSEDLAAWASGPVQVGSAVADGDGTETVTYRDTVAVGNGARRFLRVQVTRTP